MTGDPVSSCTATARSGARCRQPAVPGATVCRYHGGAAPQVRAAAARRVLTEQVKADAAKALGHHALAGVDDPVEVLSHVAAEIVAVKDALAARVNALDHIRYQSGQGEQVRAEMQLFTTYLKLTADVAEKLAKLDLEGKRQAAAERYGAEIAALLQAIFVELALSEQQWARVPVVVSHHLAGVGQLEAGSGA